MSISPRRLIRSTAALICLATFVSLPSAATHGQEAPPAEQPAFIGADQETLDARFAELLSGSKLVGQFTVDGRAEDDLPPRKEQYDLVEVRKLRGSLWLFRARIRYGDHDVTLPISLPVQWAGDTPVIIVDNVGFPGLGTYSARVLFHGDHYVGTWQGADHGGHMFGRIERGEAVEEAARPVPSDTESETQRP